MAPQRKTAIQQQRQRAAANGTTAGPAVRTRAAVRQQQHQQQQHAADMVLPLLLQHDSVRTRLRLVCSLLCCSKAVAAAVAEHCAGQLDIPRQPTAAAAAAAAAAEGHQQFEAWLHRHARLVRSLDLFSSVAADCAVSALVAAGPQTLALQSLKVGSSATTLPLLEQLPAHSLTRLDWRVPAWPGQPQDLPAFVARLSAALGRLTGLRALALVLPADGSLELPGLSGLTQLTSLCYGGPASDLQHAPPQLLELELPWCTQPLELSHLTALTALTACRVEEGDVLPANLYLLHVSDDCRSVQPLLGLQRLQQMELRLDEGTDITAHQLRQLSSLSALSLRYGTLAGSTEPASSAAWPVLSLRRLELHSASLSPVICQRLAQLSGLTRLRLWQYRRPQAAASAQQLAAALRQLSGLQQLQLVSDEWRSGDIATADSMRQLVQAVGCLQHLRGLGISYFKPLAAAVAAGPGNSLAALTGLTALSVDCCDLNDADVASIVSQLPGLQSLDCSWNHGMSDAALSAIGRLGQLTGLSLSRMKGVTDAGLQHLTGLVRLTKLNLAGTGVTDAGMHHLTRLTRLQDLVVPGRVSVQQRRWLEQQLPDLVCRAGVL